MSKIVTDTIKLKKVVTDLPKNKSEEEVISAALFTALEKEKGFAEAITKKGSDEKLTFFNLGKDNNYKKLLNNDLINKMNNLFQNELIKYNYE